MFYKNGSNLAKLVIIAAVVMTALIIVSGVATASSNCKKVEGKLTLNPDTTGSYRVLQRRYQGEFCFQPNQLRLYGYPRCGAVNRQ